MRPRRQVYLRISGRITGISLADSRLGRYNPISEFEQGEHITRIQDVGVSQRFRDCDGTELGKLYRHCVVQI